MPKQGLGPRTAEFRTSLLAEVLEHSESEGHESFLTATFTGLILDAASSRGAGDGQTDSLLSQARNAHCGGVLHLDWTRPCRVQEPLVASTLPEDKR